MADEDRELIRRFIGCFGAFDDMTVTSTAELADSDRTALRVRPADPWVEWRPAPANLSADALSDLYECVPGRLPPLYELLILSYRWAQVDVGRLRLLANLPPGLCGLTAGMTNDRALFDTLVPAGFIQFGKGPDMDYDPVCFDLGSRCDVGDCRIVKFDHEEILCNRRLKEVRELAPSFRRLVELLVEDASKEPPLSPPW